VVAEARYKEEILAMLCWITILGGALIMMGQHSRSEALFYYFRLEDQVPETHLLRLIDKHISLEFVRERLRNSYSETTKSASMTTTIGLWADVCLCHSHPFPSAKSNIATAKGSGMEEGDRTGETREAGRAALRLCNLVAQSPSDAEGGLQEGGETELTER
jgi:hypothetical protein